MDAKTPDLRVETDKTQGRYCVASKSISAKTCIFEEQALWAPITGATVSAADDSASSLSPTYIAGLSDPFDQAVARVAAQVLTADGLHDMLFTPERHASFTSPWPDRVTDEYVSALVIELQPVMCV